MCHPSYLQQYATMMARFGSMIGLVLGPPLGGLMMHIHGDLESKTNENNELWLLFALLLSVSSFCLLYQLIFYHSGHSVYVADSFDDGDYDYSRNILFSFSDTVTVGLRTRFSSKNEDYSVNYQQGYIQNCCVNQIHVFIVFTRVSSLGMTTCAECAAAWQLERWTYFVPHTIISIKTGAYKKESITKRNLLSLMHMLLFLLEFTKCRRI